MTHRVGPTNPLHRYHRRWPALAGRSPAEISRQWGTAEIVDGVPEDGLQAGQYATITVRYTVGSLGLDEDGGLRLSFRFISDFGGFQANGRAEDNYVTASTNGSADLEVQIERKGTPRPFQKTIFVHVRNASLAEGKQIEIVLGDRTAGSRGWRQQTFFEQPFPVRVAVDPLGTHDYQELPYDLGWNIVPGPAARYVVNVPSIVASGRNFDVRVKAEDAWGNPIRDLAGSPPTLSMETVHLAEVLLVEHRHNQGVWTYKGTAPEGGQLGFRVDSDLPTESNAALVVPHSQLGKYGYYWCDLHGQSGETVGAGTVEDYFHFGKHYGFLDGSVHQGNDFQIGRELWERIKRASHEAYEPGEFITFPGYEWSGTEYMGGDHNVIFFEDDPPIYRSTGWLDSNPFEENAPLSHLYERLRGHSAMTIAHVGGRPAAFREADHSIEHLWEIHSAWGTFEWVYQEAVARGIKIGFVCNSDGHKGRPGASYPGAGIFGTLGGLTCVLSETMDRAGFWDALSNRRTYGTTGQRILVIAELNGYPIGSSVIANRGKMRATILGTAPVRRIDVFREGTIITSYEPALGGEPDTLLLRFGGARVRGRARMVKWKGRVAISGNRLMHARENGIFSPTFGISDSSPEGFSFDCATTGNSVNFEMRLENGIQGTLEFQSEQTSFVLDLAEINQNPLTMFEAPIDQFIEVSAVSSRAFPLFIKTDFDLEFDGDEQVPYFLRVTQLDEGKAWTSPFYVTAPNG